MQKSCVSAVSLVLCVLLSQTALCAEREIYTGKVVAVVDGDTMRVMHGEQIETIRLHGVDCPELAQPYGPEAKKFTSGLALEKVVTIEKMGVEKLPVKEDGAEPKTRIVAKVSVPEGKSLAEQVIAAGMGWWKREDQPRDGRLGSLCAKVIVDKKGLFSDPAPLAPWDFRAVREKEAAEAVQAPEKTMPGSSGAALDPSMTVFITKGGSEYHRAGCVHLDRSRKVITLKQAEKSGYTPCLICFPRKAGEETPELVQKGDLEYTPPRTPTPSSGPSSSQLAEIRQNPLYKQLNPRFQKDANGNAVGITADNISSIPFATGLGFRDGDVIRSVNGERITSEAQIMGLVERYKDTKNFTVGIVRNGQPQTLNITIPF